MTRKLDRRQVVGIAASAGALLGVGALTPPAAFSQTKQNMEIDMAELTLSALYTTSTSATSLTGEAADRVAIQELINAWAHCADRRLPEKQAGLFTTDGVVSVYMGDPATTQPVATQRGHAELIAALAGLRKYSQTTHTNGQSTVVIKGDRAVGETYCFAHQILEEGGQKKLQILSIRYYDDFVREGDRWLFATRKLIIDWSETRDLHA